MSLENHEARINQLENKIKALETGVLKLSVSLAEGGAVFLSSVKSNVESNSKVMYAHSKLFFESQIATSGILKEIISQLPSVEKNQKIVDGLSILETSIDQTQAAMNSAEKTFLDKLKEINGNQPPPPTPPPGA
jgi:hypothetical protein